MDLYRRYGIIPTLNNDGSVVMVNTMLSERARKAVANGSRHPLLAHSSKPPAPLPQHPHQDRSLSASLPASFSSPLASPRSSGDFGQRRARSSVAVREARVDVRPLSTVSGAAGSSGAGPLLSPRLGAPRNRSESLLLSSRSSSSRLHTT